MTPPPHPPRVELRGVSRTFGAVPGRFARLVGAKSSPLVHALADVDLAIAEGEVMGLVGESGSGKSTLGRIVAGLLRPSTGTVLLRGDAAGTKYPAVRRQIQPVFQDPAASLNPRMRIGEAIGEAPRVLGLVRRADQAAAIDAALQRVGLDPAMKHRFPHQLSGGQRQRVGIARALAVRPDMLVCDEAVAALDVSVQAQMLNLFLDLRRDLGLTYLFISHDLGVVEHLSDRVAIMYLGRIVEEAAADTLFRQPNHPYTQALLAEAPRLDARRRSFGLIQGEIPSPLAPPPGCHFHPRCPHAIPRCRTERPLLREIAPRHRSACHLNEVG